MTQEQITIKGVSIGDKFISSPATKRISTVIDIREIRSLVTGEVTGHICIAQHNLISQLVTFEVPFATVQRNKIK